MPSPRFKGAVLRHLAPWIRERFEPEIVERAFAALPAELARGLEPGQPDFAALPSSWYDARIYQVMLDVLLASKPGADVSTLAGEAAESVLAQTLRGIYAKLFALMASPALYARYAQKMWATHYDTGTVTVTHETPTRAHHLVEGWTGHHPFTCAINRQSGVVVYRMMGLEKVRLLSERCAPPRCEAVYEWEG